jgi:hypothetical protein
MKASQLPPEALRAENLYRQTAYWLVAFMMACAALTISQLIAKIVPDWPVVLITVLMGLLSLERLYTYRRFASLSVFSQEWFTMLGTQLVVILFIFRLAIAFPRGILGELSGLVTDIFSHFWVPEFVGVIFIAILNWTFSGFFAELIEEMGLTHGLTLLDEGAVAPRELPPARQRLISLVLSQGIVLVTLTALMRVNLRALTNPGSEPLLLTLSTSTGSLSTLAYFLFGLALLGQGQFMSLHTLWSYQRINLPAAMGRRWAAYGLGFLLLVGGVVSLLPTSFSLGFFALMSALMQAVLGTIFFVAQYVPFAFMALLAILMSIFGIKQTSPEAEAPVAPSMPQLLPPDAQMPTGNPWLDLLKSTLSWGILLALIGFSLYQFARQHAGLSSALRKWSQTLRLSTLWQFLRGFFKAAQQLTQAASANLQRLARRFTPQAPPGFNFFNPRRLDARQRIFFYYLALIRRGGEQGLPRKASQTPAEYAAALDPALPEIQPEIDSLTETFIAARYAPGPVEAPQVTRAQSLWERIRKSLRSMASRQPRQ